MLLYFLLMAGVLIICLFALCDSGHELFAPGPIFSIGFFASTLLAIVGIGSWNSVSISFEVIGIVLVGLCAFCVGCHFVNRSSDRLPSHDSRPPIVQRNWKYYSLCVVIVVAMVLRVVETYEIAAELGVDLSSYSSVVREVRRATSAFRTVDAVKLGVGFSMLERQLEKVVMAIGFVCSYLSVHNLIVENDKKGAVLPLLTLGLCIVFAFLKGGRSVVMFYALAGVIASFFLLLQNGADPKLLSKRALMACCVAALVGSVIFYFSAFLVGRKTGAGIVEYISFYFGCGVPSLQSLIDSGFSIATNGMMSFYNLVAPLAKFGVVEDMSSYSLAWINLGGFKSNVFTCFARYYFEFGITGVVLLGLLAGVLSCWVYQLARKNMSPALVVVACYVVAHTFDAVREEFVFSRLFSMNQLLIILLMVAFAHFLTASLNDDARKMRACLKRERSA